MEADTADAASIEAVVGSAAVVANLVGPYARHGEVVYEACARRGVHELDLTGETDWLAQMISEYQDIAEASEARIVPTAGFVALPFDLGMLLATDAAHRTSGEPVTDIDIAVTIANQASIRSAADAVSGGAFVSGVEALRRSAGEAFTNSYVLDPPGSTARGRYELRPRRHTGTSRWLAPMFPSSLLNPPIAHRTAALLRRQGDTTFSADFRYREGAVMAGMVPSPAAPAVATAMTAFQRAFTLVPGRRPWYEHRWSTPC